MFQVHPIHQMHQMKSFGGSQIHINLGNMPSSNITSKQITVSYQNGKNNKNTRNNKWYNTSSNHRRIIFFLHF